MFCAGSVHAASSISGRSVGSPSPEINEISALIQLSGRNDSEERRDCERAGVDILWTDLGRSRRDRLGIGKNELSEEKDKKDSRMLDERGPSDRSAKKDLESREDPNGSMFWWRPSLSRLFIERLKSNKSLCSGELTFRMSEMEYRDRPS